MLIQELEKTFDLFLKTNGSSPVTRKNYLADLRHFLGWFILALKSRKVFFIDTDSYSLLQHLNSQVISNYSSFLISNKVAPSTVNRRLSTLRKFCKFALSQQLITYDAS